MRSILTGVCFLFFSVSLISCKKGLLTSKPPVTLQQAWASDNTLRTPESALFDPARNTIYVSNINSSSGAKKDGDGFISKLSPKGEIEELYWVSGLNDPKGMAQHNNVLYVADVDEVVAISTQTGAVLGKYAADGAKFLNDVAVDESGNVYITDSSQKRIYLYRNGKVSTWMESTEREKPNGILLDGDRMIVAFMSTGEVRSLDPTSKRWTEWAEGIQNADGIVAVDKDSYLVSSWDGEVYFVNKDGRKWKVLDTKAQNINAADISYADGPGLLLVPTFKDNRLVAYTLNRN